MSQILLLVFLLTGATSLIFQVVWTRLLLLSIGTTSMARGRAVRALVVRFHHKYLLR